MNEDMEIGKDLDGNSIIQDEDGNQWVLIKGYDEDGIFTIIDTVQI